MQIFWQGPTWPRVNSRFHYAKFNQFGAPTSETTSTQIGSERVLNRPETRARTRWLAVPRVRFHARLGGSSRETQEPARWRRDDQLDYALRWLSRKMSRRTLVETKIITGCVLFGNARMAGRLKPAILKPEIAVLLSDTKSN